MLTVHGTETRDSNHHGEEHAAKGAEEGTTKVQCDSITPGNDILWGKIRLGPPEESKRYLFKNGKVGNVCE